MPEGDTVWRVARSLDRALSGRALTRTDFRVPPLATVDLSGRTVTSTLARGKHLLTRIGDDHTPHTHTLHTHLKMEGAWHLYAPGAPWKRPAHEARVVLEVAERVAVGFALGVVELLAGSDEENAVGHLGPDLLGPDWDADLAVANLLTGLERPVGEALLDQRNLAGIGNLYRSELCFLAGVPPAAPVAEVPDLPRLVRRAKALLEANKERVEQSTTGDLRSGRRTYVYRQRACRRCGSRIEVGADDRGRATYRCPSCQP
ncbi:MAG TPA: DNA-formamidopyrimidine glycosylase family protein [Nocardioides sp.]